MKNLLIVLSVLFFALASCEKEETPPKIVPSNPNQPITN